jgi:hypothetical protein
MLFKIEKKKPIWESNPEMRLIKEFQAIEDASKDDKKIRFVILVADYKSPLRQHPEAKRRELAALQAGYTVQDNSSSTIDFRGKKLVDGKDPLVEAAIVMYKKMQHNEHMDGLEIIQRQIDNIKSLTATPAEDALELGRRNTLIKDLPSLYTTKRELLVLAGHEEKISEESTSERTLSLLDELHLEETSDKDEN